MRDLESSNDLECLFRVKFSFRARLAGSDRTAFEKELREKLIKIDTMSYCQRCKSSAGTDSIRFVPIFGRAI